MTITGAAGAKASGTAGADRIVTARELSPQEIWTSGATQSRDREFCSRVHCAIVIPVSACSAACWEDEAETGENAHSPCRLPYQVSEAERALNGRKTAYVLESDIHVYNRSNAGDTGSR